MKIQKVSSQWDSELLKGLTKKAGITGSEFLGVQGTPQHGGMEVHEDDLTGRVTGASETLDLVTIFEIKGETPQDLLNLSEVPEAFLENEQYEAALEKAKEDLSIAVSPPEYQEGPDHFEVLPLEEPRQAPDGNYVVKVKVISQYTLHGDEPEQEPYPYE